MHYFSVWFNDNVKGVGSISGKTGSTVVWRLFNKHSRRNRKRGKKGNRKYRDKDKVKCDAEVYYDTRNYDFMESPLEELHCSICPSVLRKSKPHQLLWQSLLPGIYNGIQAEDEYVSVFCQCNERRI